MSEVSNKIKFLRKILAEQNLAAFHFRGVDWFSWITGGGSSVVILTSEVGVAEVVITATEAWILTNRIENERIKAEEVSNDFEITNFPWQDTGATEKWIKEKVSSGPICSDRPLKNEIELPPIVKNYKLKMQPEELVRYRNVGRQAAEAMTIAISRAESGWTENQLAASGAEELVRRGLEPTLILVAGEERSKIFRHPPPKDKKLGAYAMMVFCARRYGLYANLTRFIFFRSLTNEEESDFQKLYQIESSALQNSIAGKTLAEVYKSLEGTYIETGFSDEVNRHHQGGPTGYLSRELVATPDSKDLSSNLVIENGMVFAWNPSLPGRKIEDTVYVGETGLEILTCDSQWPTKTINGLKRPYVWIKK